MSRSASAKTIRLCNNLICGGAVKTCVNETGKFLGNIPGETNELMSGESESEENDTVGR